MKQKYGDQDEEEREMRMNMLGAKQVSGFDLKKHQDKEKFTDINDVKEEDESSEDDEQNEDGELQKNDAQLEEEKEELDENLLNLE